MNLLVTGGAGFIGSNFVRRRRAARPGDRIVVLDALTYAGHIGSIADVPRIRLRARRHLRRRRRRAHPPGPRHRRDRALRRREPRRSLDPRPRGLRADQRHRHRDAAREGARRRDRAFPPRLDGRGLRRSRSDDPAFTEKTLDRAALAVLGVEGGLRSPGRAPTSRPITSRRSSRAAPTTTARISSPRSSSRS